MNLLELYCRARYRARAATVSIYFLLYPAARRRRVSEADPELEFFLLPALVDRTRAAVDVGANIGTYSLALSSLVPSVYAVEPSALATDMAKYFPKNVRVCKAAASDWVGRAELQIPILGDHEVVGLASIESGVVGANYRSVAVPTIRLDDLVQERVGFIKIDVEGHELSVLKGSGRLLKEHSPTLLIELEERHRQGAVALVKAFLSQFDYAGFFVHNWELQSIDDFSNEIHQNPQRVPASIKRRVEMDYVNNFMFVPAAAVKEFRSRIAAWLPECHKAAAPTRAQ